MKDVYDINPWCALIYFCTIIFFSMIFVNPFYCILNMFASFLCSFCINRKGMITSFKYNIGLAILLAVINPLFNTKGKTVLFMYFNRNYTLEALIYGIVLACMLISGINWFGCMGRVITQDKFIFIFGTKLPNLCMLISVITGLIPFFQDKLSEIYGIQTCIFPKNSKIKNAFLSLSGAADYAFEHAVNLSISMKNRGYGSGSKTMYKRYNFAFSDIIFICIVIFLSAFIIPSVKCGIDVQFIPNIILPQFTFSYMLGLCCYAILVLLPCFMCIFKEIRWIYLKSKI